MARGRDLVFSSDKTFLTGGGRHLESLGGKKKVWVAPLRVVSIAQRKARTLVEGLVSVGGFDWR